MSKIGIVISLIIMFTSCAKAFSGEELPDQSKLKQALIKHEKHIEEGTSFEFEDNTHNWRVSQVKSYAYDGERGIRLSRFEYLPNHDKTRYIVRSYEGKLINLIFVLSREN